MEAKVGESSDEVERSVAELVDVAGAHHVPHGVHVVAPGALCTVPAGHVRQSALPADGLKVPTSHGAHCVFCSFDLRSAVMR